MTVDAVEVSVDRKTKINMSGGKNKLYIWKNKEEKKFPIKMNFPPIACLYKTDASKKRGGRTWMKRIS